ncbi:MAG: transporter, family, tetracycline resistance protein [Solirubrobacteraceae bacterium]|nr:transporter, family, tetracycline resistance protein [Solirubrobacteraceae bacterium]
MATTAQSRPPERDRAGGDPDEGGDRPLDRGEWRTLAVLGVPTFALALAITTVTTYLPVIAESFAASTLVIGLLIGGEGLLALGLPVVVGAWSDRLRTRIGGRLPFLIVATPPLVLSLAILGWARSILAAAIIVAAFFAAYYVAYEPYRALYPDLVDDDIAGRAQSTQALFRGAATCLALVGGGLLISIGGPVPFVVAAAITALCMAAFTWALLRRGLPEQTRQAPEGLREVARSLRDCVADRPALRSLLAANALWELSLAALKTFVILYITRGLGFEVSTAALIIGGGAVVIMLASPVSGKLADRLGRTRVMHIALWVYGVGLLVPVFTQSTVLLALAVPLVAFGGGVIMTLPYALLMPLMPEGQHGALSGFYSLSRGVGTALGPLLAGLAIELLRDPLSSTHGYAAMWLVSAAAILASIPLLLRVRAEMDDEPALDPAPA